MWFPRNQEPLEFRHSFPLPSFPVTAQKKRDNNIDNAEVPNFLIIRINVIVFLSKYFDTLAICF